MEKKKSILDYLSRSVLEIIFDNYCSDYPDICVAINDLDENIIVARNFHPICSNFNRKNRGTEKLCLECNSYITKHLHENDYIEHKCGNGLVDIAFPIKHKNEHIGTFYIGQVFIEGDETDMKFFEEHAQKFGFDKDEYLKAAKTIKTLSRNQVNYWVDKIRTGIYEMISVE